MISITDPIRPAIAHTRRLLFEPFSFQKWLVLGFSAFLAQLGQGGSYNFNGNPFDHSTRKDFDFEPVATWISEHLPLVIALVILIFMLILALAILFQWLSSRGQFLFLDGVARDRAEIAEPWTRLRGPGNQLFGFRLKLLLAGFALFFLCGGLGVLIALPDIHARHFGTAAILGLVVAGGLLLLGLLAMALIGALLHDFVVPVMYQRQVGVAAAWTALRQELLPGQAWKFVGFYLLSLLLELAAALLMLLGCCLTCCVALLPYISSVVFLPIHVFFRCYSLGFLEQFGEEWRIIQVPLPLAEA
ncbi:MAG: hypothetical protein IPP58_09090 [Holophagaceae bacterium]|uniref:DUF4013 domain-containing protein n=1 Tax=Candidatus Geothrix skivensis TaxID=2954439 RepID=A0A9D7XLL7_9BACT|nr:hypothetical protein [Candidatus Geothrix skivensis]